jgi:hypothetical protein
MTILRRFLIAFGAAAAVACAPVDTPAETPPVNSNVEITLTRSVCYGFCPDYTVTVTGDGQVRYEGRRFVNAVGARAATVPREDVAGLLQRFDQVGFERLNNEYRGRMTDLPTYTVTLVRNGQRKTVLDYGGVDAGMPREVRDLQREIDRVAQTAQWVLRDGQPVREQPEH